MIYFFCLSYVVPINSSRHALMQEHIFDRRLSFIAELNSTHEYTFDRLLSFIAELNSTHEHAF